MLKQLVENNHSVIKEGGIANSPSNSTENQSDPTNGNVSDTASIDYDNTFRKSGIPVVILHEGGYCAAIVALMATKRLNFNIVIPEQIIMMDQQQPVVEDHHQSLLRRFSSHSQMSGRDIKDLDGPIVEPVNTPSPASNTVNGGDTPGRILASQVHTGELMDDEESQLTGDENRKMNEPVKRKATGKDRDKVKKSKLDPSTSQMTNASTASLSEDKDPLDLSQDCGDQDKEDLFSADRTPPVTGRMGQGIKENVPSIQIKENTMLGERRGEEEMEDAQDTEDSNQAARDAFSAEDYLDVSITPVRPITF